MSKNKKEKRLAELRTQVSWGMTVAEIERDDDWIDKESKRLLRNELRRKKRKSLK